MGTQGNDSIEGTDDDDVIVAFEGDDQIDGQGGVDPVCAGAGDDRVALEAESAFGGPGRDSMSAANDELLGGIGDDWLDAGAGIDALNGGHGTDTCLNAATTVACEL